MCAYNCICVYIYINVYMCTYIHITFLFLCQSIWISNPTSTVKYVLDQYFIFRAGPHYVMKCAPYGPRAGCLVRQVQHRTWLVLTWWLVLHYMFIYLPDVWLALTTYMAGQCVSIYISMTYTEDEERWGRVFLNKWRRRYHRLLCRWCKNHIPAVDEEFFFLLTKDI